MGNTIFLNMRTTELDIEFIEDESRQVADDEHDNAPLPRDIDDRFAGCDGADNFLRY